LARGVTYRGGQKVGRCLDGDLQGDMDESRMVAMSEMRVLSPLDLEGGIWARARVLQNRTPSDALDFSLNAQKKGLGSEISLEVMLCQIKGGNVRRRDRSKNRGDVGRTTRREATKKGSSLELRSYKLEKGGTHTFGESVPQGGKERKKKQPGRSKR